MPFKRCSNSCLLTLGGFPAQGESGLPCSLVSIQGEVRFGSSTDLLVVKDLVALRSSVERRLSSRGDHRHAAVQGELEGSSRRLSYLLR